MASSHQHVNPYLLTLPQLISAKAKIGKVAAFYDPNKISLKGFDALALSPTEFREQLRRNLAVKLTDAELGAIVMLFDSDGDGKIGSIEFINEFLKLGVENKKKMKLLHAKVCDAHEKHAARIAAHKQAQIERLTKSRIATEWTDEEEESALSKLAMAAYGYDSLKGGLEGFYAVLSLTVVEFTQQLRRNFSLFLTAPEASALINMIDPNGGGSIDTKLFIDFFFRLKASESERHFHRQERLTHIHHEQEKERLAAVDEKYCKLVESHISPATEADQVSVLKKFREAALTFKKNVFVDVIEKAFESEDLSPTAFQNLVLRNFEIHLSPGELDAAITLFDDNGDGKISCVEFKCTFFKLAMQERSRLLARKQFTEEKRRRQAIEREQAIMQKMLDSIQTNVEWPVLPPLDDDEDMGSFASGSVLSPGQLGVEPEMDDRSVGSWSAGGGSSNPIERGGGGGTSVSGIGGQRSTTSSRRARKLSMMDILSGDKEAQKLSRTNSSITTLYPKASQDAKDFIMQLEQQEKELNDELDASISDAKSGRTKKKPANKRKGSKSSGVESVGGFVSSNSSLTTLHTDRSSAMPRKHAKSKKHSTKNHFDEGQPNKVVLQPLAIKKMNQDSESLDEMFNKTGELPIEERSDLRKQPSPPLTAGTTATDEYYDDNDFEATQSLSRPVTSHSSRPSSRA